MNICRTIKIEEINRYIDITTIRGYCKACEHYGVNHSCPPYDNFDTSTYIKNFSHVSVCVYTAPAKALTDSDKINEFYSTRKSIDPALYELEAKLGLRLLLPGKCIICDDCKPVCIHPDMLRYSFESLGIDVSKLIKGVLDIDLVFDNTKHMFVYGFLHEYEPVSIPDWRKNNE